MVNRFFGFAVLIVMCLGSNLVNAKTVLANSLDGRTIRFQIVKTLNSKNPQAVPAYELHFSKQEYQYTDPRTQSLIIGNYKYRVLNRDKGIMLITFEEVYKNAISTYSMVLYAKDDKTGLYIYKKYNELIGPASRMNFGKYLLT